MDLTSGREHLDLSDRTKEVLQAVQDEATRNAYATGMAAVDERRFEDAAVYLGLAKQLDRDNQWDILGDIAVFRYRYHSWTRERQSLPDLLRTLGNVVLVDNLIQKGLRNGHHQFQASDALVMEGPATALDLLRKVGARQARMERHLQGILVRSIHPIKGEVDCDDIQEDLVVHVESCKDVPSRWEFLDGVAIINRPSAKALKALAAAGQKTVTKAEYSALIMAEVVPTTRGEMALAQAVASDAKWTLLPVEYVADHGLAARVTPRQFHLLKWLVADRLQVLDATSSYETWATALTIHAGCLVLSRLQSYGDLQRDVVGLAHEVSRISPQRHP